MNHEYARTISNRFNLVDLLIDVFIFASAFTFPISVSSEILLQQSDSIFVDLLQLMLLLVGYFGMALYVSQMYCATAIKNDRRLHYRVLFPTNALFLFTVLIVITILFSTYNLFQILNLPVFSSLLLIVESLIFGFSLGLDFGIERHRSEDPKYDPPKHNAYSESLTNIPYILFTLLFVFPTEYAVSMTEMSIGLKILGVIMSLLFAIFVSYKLDQLLFRRLQITAKMNAATIAAVSILMVVGFVGIDVLQVIAESQTVLFGTSEASRILSLFFFGIVPVRLGSILFSRAGLFNKLVGSVALIAFLIAETGLISIKGMF